MNTQQLAISNFRCSLDKYTWTPMLIFTVPADSKYIIFQMFQEWNSGQIQVNVSLLKGCSPRNLWLK